MYNITFSLESHGKIAMYEQLYRQLVADIRSGQLACGEKLPSKRALCAHLGISRSTVETAYGLLVSEGYVTARARSGYYVSDFIACPAPPDRRFSPILPPPRSAPAPEFDFSTSSVDTSQFPYSSWAKLNKEVVYSSPELLQRGDRRGDPALRFALCSFLSEYRGVRCVPEQIVIGAGMEYLTGLLLQLLPTDAVFALEDPGYGAIYHTVQSAGRSLCPVPLDEYGMDACALASTPASVAYITPSHQFPMGITMPAWRRTQLLRWAADGPGRFIVEDDYDSEFRYVSRPVPAMQSMDEGDRVIYIGTFSRSVAPSIRIAYMVLPEALQSRYAGLFAHTQSTVSRYEQAVMARFISEGYYARYLRRVGSLYKRRCNLLVSGLECIPGVHVAGAEGGIHFLTRHETLSEDALVHCAAAQGIALRGLSDYAHFCGCMPSTVVMGFGGLSEARIPRALARLRLAWGHE